MESKQSERREIWRQRITEQENGGCPVRKEDRARVDGEEASTPDEDVESCEVTPFQPQSEEDGDQSSAYSAALMVR